jgi:hypothetical protein
MSAVHRAEDESRVASMAENENALGAILSAVMS